MLTIKTDTEDKKNLNVKTKFCNNKNQWIVMVEQSFSINEEDLRQISKFLKRKNKQEEI